MTSTRTDLPECSILEVLADVRTLPVVDEESDLYIFATELFEQRIEREVYTGFESQAAKLRWLQHHFNKQTKGLVHYVQCLFYSSRTCGYLFFLYFWYICLKHLLFIICFW